MKIAVVYTATTPELTAGIGEEIRKNLAGITGAPGATGVEINIASYQNAAILQEARDAGGLTPNCARKLMDLYEQAVAEGAGCIFNVCSSVGRVVDR